MKEFDSNGVLTVCGVDMDIFKLLEFGKLGISISDIAIHYGLTRSAVMKSGKYMDLKRVIRRGRIKCVERLTEILVKKAEGMDGKESDFNSLKFTLTRLNPETWAGSAIDLGIPDNATPFEKIETVIKNVQDGVISVEHGEKFMAMLHRSAEMKRFVKTTEVVENILESPQLAKAIEEAARMAKK